MQALREALSRDAQLMQSLEAPADSSASRETNLRHVVSGSDNEGLRCSAALIVSALAVLGLLRPVGPDYDQAIKAVQRQQSRRFYAVVTSATHAVCMISPLSYRLSADPGAQSAARLAGAQASFG